MESYVWLIPAFFLTALTYASVGFGGGSTYLALMVLAGLSYKILPPLALVCNLIVVTGGLYHFARNGHLRLSRLLPFVIASLPFAYLGGKIKIGEELFLALLALSLAVAGLRLLLSFPPRPKLAKRESRTRFALSQILDPRSHSPLTAGMTHSAIGAVIGFLSGLVGIGGGIFLAPLLYLFRWGNAREIAAAASFFIFANSIAGLAGQLQKIGGADRAGELLPFWPLAVAVFAGGQIGSLFSVGVFSLATLQRATAVLILMVSGRIFWGLL